MNKNRLSAVILVISLSSCTETVYITKPLPIPEPLEIDWVRLEADLSSVPDRAYEDVVRIDKRRETLRQILESTQQTTQ